MLNLRCVLKISEEKQRSIILGSALFGILFSLIMLFVVLLTSCSDEGNHGVYSDVPADIAYEVEHTTFVEPSSDDTRYTGFELAIKNIADSFGVPLGMFKIILGMFLLLILMGTILIITSSFVATSMAGFAEIMTLVYIGILPIYFALLFFCIVGLYILWCRVDGKKERK